MTSPIRAEWSPASCCSEYDFATIRSWFGALPPEDWGNPLAAEMLLNKDDVTKKVRAIFRRPDGQLREAVRTIGRTHTITIGAPSASTIKRLRLAEAVAP